MSEKLTDEASSAREMVCCARVMVAIVAAVWGIPGVGIEREGGRDRGRERDLDGNNLQIIQSKSADLSERCQKANEGVAWHCSGKSSGVDFYLRVPCQNDDFETNGLYQHPSVFISPVS